MSLNLQEKGSTKAEAKVAVRAHPAAQSLHPLMLDSIDAAVEAMPDVAGSKIAVSVTGNLSAFTVHVELEMPDAEAAAAEALRVLG